MYYLLHMVFDTMNHVHNTIQGYKSKLKCIHVSCTKKSLFPVKSVSIGVFLSSSRVYNGVLPVSYLH